VKAIPQFQKALTITPDSFSYSNLGTAYFFLKRYDESVKMYEKATEMTRTMRRCSEILGTLTASRAIPSKHPQPTARPSLWPSSSSR